MVSNGNMSSNNNKFNNSRLSERDEDRVNKRFE